MKKRVVPTGLPEALFSGRMPGFTFNFPVLVDRVFVKKSMTDLIDEIKNCGGCDFREYCKHPVPPELGRTNVMIVGEAPGWEEDKGGRPFIGKSGRKLDQALARFGLSGKEFTYSNGAKCAPPFTPKGEDGVMTVAEIEKLSKECPWLEKEMAIIRPPLILALGRRAWQKLGGQGTITKANGCVKNLRDIKVVACLHPAYVLRNSNLESDMDQAIEKFAGLYRALVPSDGKPPVRRVPEPLSFRDRARRLLSEPNQARGGP
jgi:DNA polymerase